MALYKNSSSGFVHNESLVGVTAGDKFGASLSLSGDFLAVGAPAANSSDGVVKIYRFVPTTVGGYELFETLNGTGAEEFGSSVAMEGGRLVVGAPKANSGSGVIYVYEFDRNTDFVLIGKKQGQGEFGSSVAIHGQNLSGGAPLTDLSGIADAGAALLMNWFGL